MRSLILFVLVTPALLTLSCAYQGYQAKDYHSLVSFSGPNVSQNSSAMIQGQVGHRFSAFISYYIGFAPIVASGQSTSVNEPYVTDPEYALFGHDKEKLSASGLPAGLVFDSATGMIEGTPRTPGKWMVYPAVHCQDRGNNVYRGNGSWLSTYVNSGGKVWTVTDRPATIEILEY
jgi:hypothetical protein